jgi:hypothetical protein
VRYDILLGELPSLYPRKEEEPPSELGSAGKA